MTSVKGNRQGLPESNLETAIKAYRDALKLGLNPRPTLARDTHSAVDTVARWFGEARRRGYLPPTTPGKKRA